MAKYAKLDMYDFRLVYAGFKLVSVEINDLSTYDVGDITGEFVLTDNLAYVDSHYLKVKEFKTGESRQFVGRNTLELSVEEVYQ